MESCVKIKDNASRRYSHLEHKYPDLCNRIHSPKKSFKEHRHFNVYLSINLNSTYVSGKKKSVPTCVKRCMNSKLCAFFYLSVRNNHILQP
jgi:hypothetical protein